MIDTIRRAPLVAVLPARWQSVKDNVIAWGALVGTHSVLVPPEPARGLFDPDARGYEVLLGPAVVDADAIVERFTVTDILRITSLPGYQGADGDALARLDFDETSAYRPVPTAPTDLEAGQGADNLWQYLEQIGVLPPGFDRKPSDEWLDAVDDLLTQRKPPIREAMLAEGQRDWCLIPWIC